MGYHQAGFDEIVGVDIAPQPNYPFTFVQGDALEPPVRLDDFDLIHASPPCQAFTQMSARWRGKGGKADTHPDLLAPTRDWFGSIEQPWVIENVVGAGRQMSATLTLHGGMFGLGVHRPRLFESSWLIFGFKAAQTKSPVGVYGKPDGREVWRYRNNGSPDADGKYKYGKPVINAWKSVEQGQALLEVPWMTDELEIREAIPPAYTKYIGEQFLAQQ